MTHTLDACNPLPIDKSQDWSILKTFALNKVNVGKSSRFVLGKIENIVGSG